MWVRVSNAVQDPVTSTALAQDQVVRVVTQEDDWYSIETLDGEKGRLPKVLANELNNPLRSSTESVYCAIAPFQGERDGDLPFSLYAILVVESVESDGWFRGVVVTDNGKRLGKSGIIPMTYVKQLMGFEVPAAAANIPSSFTSDFSTDKRFQNVTVSPYARAVYSFVGEFANELSFQADELIQLTRRIDSDWLEGAVGGRSGMFPQSFVQIVVPLEGETIVSESQPSPQDGSGNDGIGYAIVRHDFNGRQKDELSVKIGDSIRVIRMANNDWVECKDPATDAVGIVPVSFLELYLDEDDDEPKSKMDNAFGSFGSQPFASSSSSDWRTTPKPDDTSSTGFQPSESVKVSAEIDSSNAGWATFGEDWLVPEKKTTPPARPPPPKTVVSAVSPNEMVTFAEMFAKADNAIATANGTKESTFDSLGASSSTSGTIKEKKARVLEELINTELQFVSDMNTFVEAVDNSAGLTPKQKAILKSGCAQIVQLAGNLVLGLTTEQGRDFESQAVGACFLSLRKAFAQTYGYYFRNIEQINDLLQKCKSDVKLESAMKEIVRKMQSNGATVIDYTTACARPVQRCLKYPIFLSELVKYTPIQHNDHPKLNEAVKQMSTLGQKMNESRRRKELTKKYAEDQPGNSFTDMLSKLTVHSIKKKSNRFTYRMGSSLGVVKVARDSEFDCLVNELDACERRLVRFNYSLVIYKKKIFFETRQLIQKKLVDPRKKQVVLAGVDIDKEVQPFHDEVKVFAEMINTQVRDEIVKALRAIPKKLIKKRNDKLMDWESVKSKEKSIGPQNHKFLDFEALNAQVKQTVPKVIEVLHKVLREAMETVRVLDANLIIELKRVYNNAAQADATLDSYLSSNRLIVPSIPCFAIFYDENRLQPLQGIVNKAERKARNHAFIAAGVEKAAKPRRGSAASVPGREEFPAPINFNTPSIVNSTAIDNSGKKTFRAQTAEERQTILQKAELKDRRKEMYKVVTDWPATREGLEENKNSGRMLICNKGDAVLLVSKQKDGLCVCYNGYYNAFLPFAIMAPWYENTSKTTAAITRPHSTPPKSQQPAMNLIDLDDSPTDTVPALQPNVYPSLVPSPVPSADIFGAPLVPSVQSISPQIPTSNGPPSLLEQIRPIDWGSSIVSQSNPFGDASPFETSLTQKTPSLPNLSSVSPAFPVTFDDSPKDVSFQQPAPTTLAHLPPPGPSHSSANSSAATPSQDTFTSLWEQIKSQPLSKRSESPQPLIPTRPESNLIPTTSTVPAPAFDFAQFGAYDTVPIEPIAPLYSNLSNTQPPPTYTSATYDSPPSEIYVQPPSMTYDVPPVEAIIDDPYRTKSAIGNVQALYDFNSQDQHQINLRAGEKLQLLQAHDDFGSEEWILVRPAVGRSGYVPANYCSRC